MKTTFKLTLVLLIGQAITIHAATTVTNIAAAADHSLFLKSDGSLWAMGRNDGGQLGDGTTNNCYSPEEIVAGGVVAVAAGGAHNLFLKSDGSLWAMGQNSSGQLGDGTFNNTNRPEQIVASGVVAVAAGDLHSLFLKADGSLWGMGHNLSGELGDGTYNRTNRPEQIVSGGVTAIAAHGLTTLFLKSDGSLWATGDDRYGQLGDGTSGPFNQTNTPQQIVTSGVVAVAAGGLHNLFLKSDGSLWAMGNNDFGQLGDGTTTSAKRPEQIVSSNVVAIAGGGDHSLLVKSNGSLWVMGWGTYGQLGDGQPPTAVYNYYTNRPEQILTGEVTAIAGGGAHSLFIKFGGSLWAMGSGSSGQLGDGFTDIGSSYSSLPDRIIPPSQPVLANVIIASVTNVQLKATCYFRGSYCVLAGTNIAQPLSEWTPVRTNSVTGRGTNNFTATLSGAVNSSAMQGFYILRSQ